MRHPFSKWVKASIQNRTTHLQPKLPKPKIYDIQLLKMTE